MEYTKDLAELSKEVCEKIYTSKNLIDILQDILADDKKSTIILEIVKNNLETAFEKISKCRSMIHIVD